MACCSWPPATPPHRQRTPRPLDDACPGTPTRFPTASAEAPRTRGSAAESGGGFHQAVPVQAVEHVVDGAGRPAPGVGDALDRPVDDVPVQVDLVEDEFVGMLSQGRGEVWDGGLTCPDR